MLVARLSHHDVVERLASLTGRQQVDLVKLRADAQAIRQRLEGLTTAFAEGAIDMAQLKTGTERLRAKLNEVESQQGSAQARSPATIKLATAPDVGAMWDGLDLEVRRQIIRDLMSIRMLGPGAGVRTVTEKHVQIEWR